MYVLISVKSFPDFPSLTFCFSVASVEDKEATAGFLRQMGWPVPSSTQGTPAAVEDPSLPASKHRRRRSKGQIAVTPQQLAAPPASQSFPQTGAYAGAAPQPLFDYGAASNPFCTSQT